MEKPLLLIWLLHRNEKNSTCTNNSTLKKLITFHKLHTFSNLQITKFYHIWPNIDFCAYFYVILLCASNDGISKLLTTKCSFVCKKKLVEIFKHALGNFQLKFILTMLESTKSLCLFENLLGIFESCNIGWNLMECCNGKLNNGYERKMIFIHISIE